MKLRNETDNLRKKEYSIKEKISKIDNEIFMKKIELDNKYSEFYINIIPMLQYSIKKVNRTQRYPM